MTRLRRLVGRDLPERLAADIATRPGPTGPTAALTEADLAALAPPVRRSLGFMGAVGRPRVRSFRTRLRGRFRMRPGQGFMPAEIWQYDTVAPIARVFWMRIDVAGLVPMVGRDSYTGGRGRMLGKLLDTVVVADGRGDAFDFGELTTWLNDAVMMAPSMLLDAGATFAALDDTSFEVAVTDGGRTVRARVELDGRGAPVTFDSEDRFADLPAGLVRARWSTPVGGWQRVDGRELPTTGTAVWHLPEGDFTYAEFAFPAGDFEPNPGVRPKRVGAVDGTRVSPDGAASRAVRRPTARGGFADTLEGVARIAGTLLAAPLLRRGYNRWGATEEEVRAALPGDELVPTPVLRSTRAVRIEAPPTAVWPWLVQIGQGRGGLYSYDALENFVGCDLHSADAILAAHQRLAPGDLVRLGPPGYPCFEVASVDPGRSLVLVGADPRTERAPATPIEADAAGATWQWVLHGTDGGAATRLVSRQRNAHPAGRRMMWRIVEPIGFVMERRMLLGIRDRAERPGR